MDGTENAETIIGNLLKQRQPPRTQPDLDTFMHWLCLGLATTSEGHDALDWIGRGAVKNLKTAEPGSVQEATLSYFLEILSEYHTIVTG